MDFLLDFTFKSHLIFGNLFVADCLSVQLDPVDIVFEYIILINLALILNRTHATLNTTLIAAHHRAYHRLNVFLSAGDGSLQGCTDRAFHDFCG